jgi:hypothetical protein
MKAQAMLRSRVLVAVGAGACLVFTTFAAWAVTGLTEEGSRLAATTSSSSTLTLPGHLVLHGVRFDTTTGQLERRLQGATGLRRRISQRKPQGDCDGGSKSGGRSE